MMDSRVQELKELLPRCMLYDWVRLGSRLARLIRDYHHPDRHDAVLDRLLERGRASVTLREWRATHRPVIQYPPALPISSRKDEILAAIRHQQVVIVAGETGSGKTTQLPKICLEAGFGIGAKIGCTQPRRVAALSVSRRIAEELGVEWSREVGCKIRFDDRSSPQTFVKLMTDGILLAEVQGDPFLSEYEIIVIDEAHERSLNIDFLLGHLKGLLARRTDLRLVITSATIDTAAFSRAFDDAPVIEVSGRVFPVEVVYLPVDPSEEDAGDITYVDAAVRQTESLLQQGGRGDILIFMPGERDIREACEQLESRAGQRAEIVTLYGRLSSGDQQRVFSPGNRRRVIVATNIAETSLTIPGIRFVIDSGLARISRYNPRTRTRRLPIEPVSRGSADQRKGRAGRVEDGVCIRLYSEDDFSERPEFTQPEIQRANLAEVILRMKAFHLGEIETFPFLNPPSPAAMQAGYGLLQELGALDEHRSLTPLGQDLARLPIDPTLGRMLLQAGREHATRELLIIASGLSIQDPRERPLDQQAAADAAHRRYADAGSDFLTLLNIWNAVHDEWESLRTQNQRRKFCRARFLSYVRMREWQDLHAQLREVLEDRQLLPSDAGRAGYAAIHRSILSGLLAHIGRREERNVFKAPGGRRMMIFPGSGLFERPLKQGRARPGSDEPPVRRPGSSQPAWIVAAEIVQTSQLFARGVAGIEPGWIIELAPHLCVVSHQHPRWSARAGRVLVDEVTTLSGLELGRRPVDYGQIEPAEAFDIFVRSALVGGEILQDPGDDAEEEAAASAVRQSRTALRSRLGRLAARGPADRELPPQLRFLEHNRRIREMIESWQTRVRRHDLGDLDEALCAFYATRLRGVSSRDALSRWLSENGGPDALCATAEALTGGRELAYDREAFPDSILVAGHPVALKYAYAPGEEHDGVTLRVPFTLADAVSPALLEWAVPGLREAKAEELLRSLPKALRVPLLPIAPKAAEIARDFSPTGPSLGHALSQFVKQRFGVRVPPSAWAVEGLPAHLRPRVEIVGADRKAVAATRDVVAARDRAAAVSAMPDPEDPSWERATRQWEQVQISQWSFEDLPEKVPVGRTAGLEVFAWPGLEKEADKVNVRLYRTAEAACRHSLEGFRRLVEIALAREFAWLQKDLKGLASLAPLHAPLGSLQVLEETAFEHLRRYVLPSAPPSALKRAEFDAALGTARHRLQGLVPPWLSRLREVLELRAQIVRRIGGERPVPAPSARSVKDFSQLDRLVADVAGAGSATGVAQARIGEPELRALLPPRFLESTSFERLTHLPRYLRALLIRLERASINPLKDRERMARLAPYLGLLQQFQAAKGSPERQQEIESFRWMLEEFRVSLCAQELGTPSPVSPRRLDEQVERLRMLA